MKNKAAVFAVVVLIVALLFSSCGQPVSIEQNDFSNTFSLKCDYGVHEEGPESLRLFGDACISPWNTHVYPLMGIDFRDLEYKVVVTTSVTQTATLLVLVSPDGNNWSILDAKRVVVEAPYSVYSNVVNLTTTLTMVKAIDFAIDGKRISPENPDGVMLIYSEFVIPQYRKPVCNVENRAVGSAVSTYLYRKIWIHDIGCQIEVPDLPIKIRVTKAPATATIYILSETGTLSRDWTPVATMTLDNPFEVYTATFKVNSKVRFVKIESSEDADYTWVVTSKISSEE